MVNWKPALLPAAFLLITIFAFSYEDNPFQIPDWSEFSQPKNEEIYFPALNPEDNVNTQKIAYFSDYVPTNVVVDANTQYPLNSKLGGTRLTWTNNGATSFEINRSTDNVNFSLVGSTAATSYDDLNITDYSVYYYKVVGKKFSHSDSPSEVATGITLDRSPPATPNVFTVTAQNSSLDRIDVNWNDVDDNSSKTPWIADNNVVGYWRLNENSGDSVADAKGTYTMTCFSAPPISFGKFGNMRTFVGSADYCKTSGNQVIATNYGTKSISASAWIKTTSTNTQAAFGYYGGTSGEYFLLGSAGGLGYFYIEDQAGVGIGINAGTVNDNVWHHIVGVRDYQNKIYLYVDGVQTGTPVADTIGNISDTVETFIGALTTTPFQPFTGSIDEAMFFGKALSATDAKNLYAHQLTKYAVNRSVGTTGTYAPVGGTLQEFTAADASDINSISGWTKVVAESSTYTIAGNKLRMFHPGVAAAGLPVDYARYDLGSALSSNNLIVEFDVNVANSDNYDFLFNVSNNTSINGSGTESVWTTINNEILYDYNSVWVALKSGLVVGSQHHVKFIINNINKTKQIYLDDILLGTQRFYDPATTAYRYFYFANYGHSTVDATWYVDNFKVTPLYDVNTLADNNGGFGLDANPSAALSAPTTSNITTSSMDVNWSPPADVGTDYNYHVTAFDGSDNDSNVVKNGGMEGDYVNGVAPYWAKTVTSGVFSRSAVSPYSGYASQKLTLTASEAANNSVYQNVGTITNGNRYVLQFNVKVTSGKIGKVELNSAGGYGNQTIATNITDSGWAPKSYYFTATGTTDTTVDLNFTNGFNQTGTWEIDDVKLIPVKLATITSGIKNYFVNCVSGGTCAAGNDANDKWVNVGAGFPTFTGLSAATQYCFTVIAQDNGDNNSAASSQGCGTTASNPAPTLAVDYNSTYARNSNLGGMSLRWDDQASETGYKVFRATDNNLFAQIATPAQNATSYSDIDLNDNSAYYYKVAAVYAGGDANSNVDSNVGIDRTVPRQPSVYLTPQSASNRIDVGIDMNYFFIEAEDAPTKVGTAAETTYVDSASTNNYVYMDTQDTDGTPTDYITFDFNSAGGTYYLWTRAISIDIGNDSLYYKIDAGAWTGSGGLANSSGNYLWKWYLNGTNIGTISRGQHTFSLGTRETQRVDAILLTNDSSYNQYTIPTDSNVFYKLFRATTSGGTFTRLGGNITVFDYNDTTATDTNTPSVPTNLSINGAATTTLNVDWNASSDTGNSYYYKVTATDAQTNDANTSEISGTLTTGIKQYMVTNATTGAKSIVSGATTKTITGLDVNASYCFTALATDNADNNSSATAQSCKFTLANVPSAPTVNNATATTLDVAVNVNSNPAATQFAIYDANLVKWVQSDGNASGSSETWQTNVQWGTKTVTGLSASSQHCFQVKARNGNLVETALSSQTCGSTSGAAVTDLVATPQSKAKNSALGGIDLSWSDVVGETNYTLYRSTNGTTYTTVGTVSQNAVSYADNTLSDNTLYYYILQANFAGGDLNSNIPNVFTPDRTAPTHSSDLAGSYTLNQVNLTWSKGTDNNSSQAALDYNVMRNTTAVDSNASYSKIIKLDDAASYSDTTANDNANPNSPTISSVNADSTTQLTVNWSAVLDANTTYYYKLNIVDLLQNDVNSNSITVAALSGISKYWVTNVNTSAVDLNTSATARVVTSLDVNVNYCFTVKAMDRGDNNSTSSAQSCKFTLANVPSAPTVNNATVTTLDVVVNENSNPSATQFAIYDANTSQWVQSNGALGASEAWQTDSQWSTKTVTGLSAGSQHCFQVKARNGNSVETALSGQACATTIALSAPTGLSLTFVDTYGLNSSKGDVNMTWTDNSPGEDGYKVYRSLDNSVFNSIASIAANSQTYFDNNATNGLKDYTTYYYKVSAYSGASDSNSSVVSITLPDRASPNIPDENSVQELSPLNLTFTWFATSDNNVSANITYTATCISGTGCTDLNTNIPLAVQQTTTDLNVIVSAKYGLQYCFQVKASDDVNNISSNSSPNVCYTTGSSCSQLNGFVCLGPEHGYTCNGSVINDAVDVPTGTCYSQASTVLTICNNTIDNDNDGLVDDCFCGEYYNQNVLPSQKQSLDLVFLIDRSASMAQPWETVCSTISDINSSLNTKGIDPLITVYGIGDLDGGNQGTSNIYQFCKPGDTRPGCKKVAIASCMNAYTSTPTISGFTLGDGSNPDATSEAWGLGSIWVSKNNPWRSNSGTGGGIRAQIIIGDHDPTGGEHRTNFFDDTWRGSPGNSAYNSSTEQNMVDSMITAADGNSVVLFGMYSLTELTSKNLYKSSSKYDVVELFEEFATRGNGESQLYGTDKNATIGKISNFVTQLSATKKVNCAATGGTITRLVGEDLCTGPESCTCPAGTDMNSTGHCITIVCTPGANRNCGSAVGLSGAVCGTGTQTCNGSGTNWSACSAVETESCTPSGGGNGTRACLLGQWSSCDAYSTFYVATAVKDVNGFFNPQNPSQWIPQWTNTNVNAKLICGGGLEASSQIGFGPGTNGTNYFAWGGVISSPTTTGSDKNVTYSPGVTYGTDFSLNSASLSGDVNIVIQGQDANTNWTHYSAQLEPFNFNPNYVSAFVRYRTATTRAGLSSATWSNFNPPSSEMQSVTGKWIQFNVKLARNTALATTTDPIALRGFFTEYVKNGSNPNTACLNTYYRVDTSSTATESFVPTTTETGSIVRDGQNWRLLNATDKNILFSQDGNYAIKFFSRSISNNDEPVRQINVLVKKFPDTINLSQICSGIKDGLNFDINFSSITTTEGAYKYRLYASTNPNFEYRKLLLESSSATTHSVNVANIGLSSCGDNVCSSAENCPADSLGCNFGQICSNGCQTQTSITFNANATTCNPGMNKPSLDSYCQTLFGVGFACIDGCVPITTNQFSNPVWSRTTSNTDSNYCGDGYCSGSEFCPKDSAYCGNGRTCTYGCQNSTSVCGDNTCSQFENCSTEDSLCGSGFACINGCVPTSTSTVTQTSFSPQYKFAGSSTPASPANCGDGYCSASEFCPFDNRYCTGIAGITEGICVNGCVDPYNTVAVQAFTTLTCGDSVCGIGENCPLDNAACASGFACISGCLPATGTIITNPTATRFSANKGSYDGTLWFQLEVESVTGSLSRSPPVNCQIDYESPFQIPTDGRGVVKNIQSGWGDLNLNFPTSAFGSDNNVVIDANTTAPTFTRGTMHQAYNFDVSEGSYNFSNRPRLTLDINVATLSCYNPGGSSPLYGCTASDLNKVGIYRYNTTTGDWDRITSTVNVTNLEVYADLNSFSTYGQGEDTNAPTVTLSSPSNASTITDSTPSFTASPSETVDNCYLQLATNSNFSAGQIVTGYSAVDVGSDCDYDAPSTLSDDTYYWRMKATDTSGNAGDYGSAFSFTLNASTSGGGNNAVCGNGACESGENQNNCPADCSPPQGVCTNGEIRDCGTCGSQTCSSGQWETCDEPISCGNADLIISAVAADAKVIYQASANIVANIQNNGEAIGQSFQIGIQESQGAYSDSKAISSLGASDATAVLFNIPWSESYAGQTKSFVLTADSSNVISELDESNNQRTVSIQFGSTEQCGNLVDDDYDGLIDDGCGLPNLKITNITIGTPKFVDSELIKVDFNVTIETEFEDVDTEFAVAYFKDALQTSNRVTIELIDSIAIGQQVKLLFVYTAPIGEVFRLDAPQNHDNFVKKASFAGLTNFYVEVDSGDSINEVNEVDNIITLNIQNLVPDLTITDFTIPASSVSGTQFEIIATIFNQGNFEAEAGTYSVSVYSDGIVKATVPGEFAEKNGQWIATINVPGISEGTHTITITVDSLEELVESNETNNSVSAQHDVIDSLDELYSYSTFTDREPIMVGVWNPLSLNYTHSFLIPSVIFLQTESLKLSGLNDAAVFEIYFLGSGINAKKNYQLQAQRNGTKFNSKDFAVITSTKPNVINLVNDTTISWSLNPRFLKLMDYQRLNELTFVWWELFSEQ